jgi:hypothetical protein
MGLMFAPRAWDVNELSDLMGTASRVPASIFNCSGEDSLGIAAAAVAELRRRDD